MSIYQDIRNAQQENKKLLAILLDPEKMDVNTIPVFFEKVAKSVATHIFVGGSTDQHQQTENLVKTIKKYTNLPVILFPGSYEQITNYADGILFLSLISGRNPEFLIEQQVQASLTLKESNLEVIPTSYILIDGGTTTAVQRISQTKPLEQNNVDLIVKTAVAGNFLGHQITYLEAGSGAQNAVDDTIISEVKKNTSIPLIVGGGIRSKQQLDNAYNAGADLVVIGTAFEQNTDFFDDLQSSC